MNLKPDSTTPADFPRDQCLGAVSGVQPKLLVRKVEGKFVHGLTTEELYERYDICFDLVGQLTAYCQRKLGTDPHWGHQDLLQKVRVAVEARHEWNFSSGEVNWMMRQVSAQMGWPG